MNIRDYLKLYLVLETKFLKIPLSDFLHEVLESGIKIIQLRDKYLSFEEKLEKAFEIKEIMSLYDSLFIINDNISIALKSNASGVHLGFEDEAIEKVRKDYPNLIIGYSCNNLEDCKKANAYADYAGVGPYTYTNTKDNLRKVLGVKGISNICNNLSIPAVAIGGINNSNIKDVMQSNVFGFAVSSYICSSTSPYKTSKELLSIIYE